MSQVHASLQVPCTESYWGNDYYNCAGPILEETTDSITISWDGTPVTAALSAVRGRYCWEPDPIRGPSWQRRVEVR